MNESSQTYLLSTETQAICNRDLRHTEIYDICVECLCITDTVLVYTKKHVSYVSEIWDIQRHAYKRHRTYVSEIRDIKHVSLRSETYRGLWNVCHVICIRDIVLVSTHGGDQFGNIWSRDRTIWSSDLSSEGSDTPLIDHVVMREFVSGPPSYRFIYERVRDRKPSLRKGSWAVCGFRKEFFEKRQFFGSSFSF